MPRRIPLAACPARASSAHIKQESCNPLPRVTPASNSVHHGAEKSDSPQLLHRRCSSTARSGLPRISGKFGPSADGDMKLPMNEMFTLHINGNFSASRMNEASSDTPSPEINDGYQMTGKVVDAHVRTNESQYITFNGETAIRIDRVVPNGINPETIFLSSQGKGIWKLTRTVAWDSAKTERGRDDPFVPASKLCSIAERTITKVDIENMQNDGIEYPTTTFDLLGWQAGFERPWLAFRGGRNNPVSLYGTKLGYPFSRYWWGPYSKEVATEWQRLPNTKDKETGDTVGHWQCGYATIGESSSGSWSTRLDGKLAGVPVSFSGSDYTYLFNGAGSTTLSANVTFTPVELKFADGTRMTEEDLFPRAPVIEFPKCPPGIDLCHGVLYC